MIIETIVWCIFTIFIVILSALKTKHFSNIKSFNNTSKKYELLKVKPSKSKTINDKMEYVRQKTNTGQDFMTIIISIIIFIVGFIIIIYPMISNIITGLWVSLIFSIVFALIIARIQFNKIVFEYKFIDGFIGYLFASILMVYIKFIHTIPIILLVILSILIIIISNKYINKIFGNKNIKIF
jgi:hypothetical protein